MAERKVVVVTGGSEGLGRAIVRRFAADGADIAVLARGREALEGANRDIEAGGGRALAVSVDVADSAAVESAARAVEESLGPIDIWVNDAMTTVFSFFEDITPEEYKRATEVTYLGAVWGTKAALDRMLPRDRGTIVQVGSATAYRGIPLQAPYCGAKQAMKGFFESLRCELRHKNSKVILTMVQLPGLNTPQFDHCRSKMARHPMPVPPIYQPEVAADAVHWAAHHRRREVYVGIPTVYTILGSKVAPWLAERYLARSAVDGQQTDQAVPRDRSDNLYEPVAGDAAARGQFNDQAHARSVQFSRTRHRLALSVAAAAAMLGATALSRR